VLYFQPAAEETETRTAHRHPEVRKGGGEVRHKLWGNRIAEHFFNRDVWVNFELGAVLVLAAGKFVVGDALGQHVLFALAGGGLWIFYILARIHSKPELIHTWGFSSQNLRESMRVVLPVTIAAVAAAVSYGWVSGSALFHWHMGILFLLYPLWGVVQQFLLVVLVAGNVDRITRGTFPRFFIILPTAVLFSLVHIPVPTLMFVTFFMGCFTTTLFLRYRNVWALGIFHGLLATALYYFVLGQDPLQGIIRFSL
jgi:hypothetical protein